MARVLNGSEIADFIKERQIKQVRNLRQEHHIAPKLVIIKSENSNQAIDAYVRMKGRYAADILIDVEVVSIAQNEMREAIERANADGSIHGIIIQLPLDNHEQTDELCGLIASEKDVDGLGTGGVFTGATAEAIDWLLTGYNVELVGRRIALLGHGRLVGAPLAKLWIERGLNVTVLDENSEDIDSTLLHSDVIVAATGVPRILTSERVPVDAVVVDAGTASEGGVLVGDVAPDVRERKDVTMTPEKGGVGPLTIAVLFDHVIQAALRVAGKL